jgi:DNA-binding NarL/FixJ family response regulator
VTEPNPRPIKFNVLVVGNNRVLRRGIVEYFRTVTLVPKVGEATFESALTAISGDSDWHLVAIDLEGGGDLTIISRLHEARPRIPTLVLNTDSTPASVTAALAAGASGYLGKNGPAEAWQDALEIVAGGGVYPGPA